MPCGDIDPWFNIGPGNDLLPHSTNALHDPMLTYQQRGSVGFTLRQFYHTIPQNKSKYYQFHIITQGTMS